MLCRMLARALLSAGVILMPAFAFADLVGAGAVQFETDRLAEGQAALRSRQLERAERAFAAERTAVRRSVGFRSDTPRTSLISINACGWRSRFTIDRPRVPRRPPRRALPRGYPQNAAYPQPAMACRTALRVLRPSIAAMMSDFQLPRMGTRLPGLARSAFRSLFLYENQGQFPVGRTFH